MSEMDFQKKTDWMERMPVIKGLAQKKEKDEYKSRLIKHRLVIFYRIILTIVVVAVILLVVYMNYQNMIYKDYEVMSSTPRQDSDTASYLEVNGYTLKYSQDGAEAFDGENNVLWNETYEMQNPKVETSGDYVAIGDYKGTVIYVANSTGEQGKIETKLPVENFCVAGQGVVAVVVEDQGATKIHLFDKQGGEIANFKCTMSQSGYPIDISLSEDGLKLAVSYIRISGGELRSTVAFYNFGDVGQNEMDNLVSGYDYVNTVVPKVQFMNDSTAFALGDDRLVFFTGKQKPTSSYETFLKEEVQSVFYSDSQVGLVFRTGNSENKYRIDVYSSTGEIKMSQEFNIDYKDIVLEKNSLIIYNESECRIYNDKGVEKFNSTFRDPVLMMIPTRRGTQYITVNREATEIIQLK